MLAGQTFSVFKGVIGDVPQIDRKIFNRILRYQASSFSKPFF
jgi:hypothetical protein